MHCLLVSWQLCSIFPSSIWSFCIFNMCLYLHFGFDQGISFLLETHTTTLPTIKLNRHIDSKATFIIMSHGTSMANLQQIATKKPQNCLQFTCLKDLKLRLELLQKSHHENGSSNFDQYFILLTEWEEIEFLSSKGSHCWPSVGFGIYFVVMAAVSFEWCSPYGITKQKFTKNASNFYGETWLQDTHFSISRKKPGHHTFRLKMVINEQDICVKKFW